MNLTDEQIKALIDFRGGCECNISAPCSACTDIPTDEELMTINVYCALPQFLQNQAS